MSKFNYFSGWPDELNERFWNILNWPLCEWQWKKNKLLVSNENTCISVTHPILSVQFTQDTISIIPWFIWYMYYLPACICNYCYVFNFAIKKILQILWEKFNSISIYSWKNISLSTNIKKWCLWKMAKFFLHKFVIFNMNSDSFLIEKSGTLEIARRYDCKNLLNLGCQESIRFDIFQVA